MTLERVLGADLTAFRWIAKTLYFPHQPWPQYPNPLHSLVFPWWRHEQWLRPIIGCSRAFRLAHANWIRWAFARQVASRLEQVPEIREKPFLVCPQADITLRSMHLLQRRGPLDYVTWLMDDHLVRWREGRWQYPHGMEELLRAHLRESRAVFVISETMRDFYAERFGVEATVLHAPAPGQADPVPFDSDARETVRLVYFGSLGPWQNDALEVLSSALSAGECSLDIFTRQPELLPKSLSRDGVRLLNPVSPADVQSLSARYHATVLPISFRDEMRQMTYFNIATKFSECLSGPVPTLLIGPADSAMQQLARRYSATVSVLDTSPAALQQALGKLRSQEGCGQVLAGARDCVSKEMTQAIMQGRWRSVWRNTESRC